MFLSLPAQTEGCCNCNLTTFCLCPLLLLPALIPFAGETQFISNLPINVMSPAEENSLSAALLALKEAVVVQDSKWAQNFWGEIDSVRVCFFITELV